MCVNWGFEATPQYDITQHFQVRILRIGDYQWGPWVWRQSWQPCDVGDEPPIELGFNVCMKPGQCHSPAGIDIEDQASRWQYSLRLWNDAPITVKAFKSVRM